MTAYVIPGEWSDTDYRKLQAESASRPMSLDETRTLIDGPRKHPFGNAGFTRVVGGELRIYEGAEWDGVDVLLLSEARDE